MYKKKIILNTLIQRFSERFAKSSVTSSLMLRHMSKNKYAQVLLKLHNALHLEPAPPSRLKVTVWLHLTNTVWPHLTDPNWPHLTDLVWPLFSYLVWPHLTDPVWPHLTDPVWPLVTDPVWPHLTDLVYLHFTDLVWLHLTDPIWSKWTVPPLFSGCWTNKTSQALLFWVSGDLL